MFAPNDRSVLSITGVLYKKQTHVKDNDLVIIQRKEILFRFVYVNVIDEMGRDPLTEGEHGFTKISYIIISEESREYRDTYVHATVWDTAEICDKT